MGAKFRMISRIACGLIVTYLTSALLPAQDLFAPPGLTPLPPVEPTESTGWQNVQDSSHYTNETQPNGQTNGADSGQCPPAEMQMNACEADGTAADWLEHVRVGYDSGFVIASQEEVDIQAADFPFQMQVNGWGQLRHTILKSQGPNRDINQFQLKRGRLAFSGNAFTSDFDYFIQLDGRSSSGDDIRLLDYFLTYDIGHHVWGWKAGTLGFKTGQYKMPFTMARYLSGREFEFTDRSVASMFFDVNRSFAWGLFGRTNRWQTPLHWEMAIFNGLVTGGAETGSSGTLDNNFAYSARIFAYPHGDWGDAGLADLRYHSAPATRIGAAVALTTNDREGTTEFSSIRVVDSGDRLANILPAEVDAYNVALCSIDASLKYCGWSLTAEYYLRNIDGFEGATLPNLFDQGFWLQLGKFVIPEKLQFISRWSRVEGNSGTLGLDSQSADEIAGGLVWYFRGQHAKLTLDLTHLDGAPINSSALDITPGELGWLFRTQVQFAF